MSTNFVTNGDIVQGFLANHYRLIFWPAIGDSKGPREEGWPTKQYTYEDYREGYRVGVLTGTEIAPGKFLHDVDIDWAPGSLIAQAVLPVTSFVFGRPSKRVSHCFYTCPEAIPSYRYEDIDKTCLIELRGTRADGQIGLQTMIPPSIWSKGDAREQLTFVKSDGPNHYDSNTLKQKVCLAAIGMLLAKHLGHNGFGHEARLAWAGFLLRTGIPSEDIISLGEAMSIYCNNKEIQDVRRAVESTNAALAAGGKKVKGGPALGKLLGDKGRAVIAHINGWLGRDSDFVRDTSGGIVRDHQGNIQRALQLLDVHLSYHSFNERLMIFVDGIKQPLTDAIVDNLWLRIDREMRFRPTFQFFEKVLHNLAHETTYHEVKDYLASLTWDQQPRIDEWLIAYGGAEDTEYVRAISAIVLMAAVRRIRLPGVKYDEMLVLEGEQGMDKSSALRGLCPDDTWFSDDLPLNVEAKQIIERTLGKWLIEASDLAGKRRTEVEQLKSMLSRQVDGPARMAYARSPVERPRQFILIGTTNNSAYLTDSTGARRYWPVPVKRFDVAGVIRDRDQLWAEAAYREARGDSIRLPERLWKFAAVEQDRRTSHDAWEDAIREHVMAVIPNFDDKRRVMTKNLYEAIGVEPARRDRISGARIADIMQRLGFKQTTIRVKGEIAPQRGYITENPHMLMLVEEHEVIGEDGDPGNIPF